MGGRSKALASCRIVIAGQYKGYEPPKMGGWISNLGGTTQSKVSGNTTHVVASEKAWGRKDVAVATALKLNEEGDSDIKIVSFEWLEDSVNNKTRKREGPYLWEKLDASAAKRNAAKKRADGAEEKRGHVGMMAEVFQESTDAFVGERERKRVDKQIEAEKRVREEMEAEEKRERDEERKKTAELFGRGAKKARNELFTENHHLYTDDTGFKYDVLLTKVDTRNNRNERYALTLQIYESNAEPHTYAMNCQFAGTGRRPDNNVIAAIGTIFPTAFRAFKKTFKDKTGVEWDDRIGAALERSKREKRHRGLGTGSQEGSRRGVPVDSVANGAGKGKEDVDSDKMPFEYHPPRFGPRGKLPQEKVDELVDKHSLNGVEGNERVESWMSGANGDGPATKTVRDQSKEKTPGPVQPTQKLHHFEALLNGTNDGEEYNPILDGMPDPNGDNIPDHELNEMVNDYVADNFPFDPTDVDISNMDFSAYTNPDNQALDAFATIEQHETSFDQSNDTTHSQFDPTSFDLPASTVQESFQPGTQDVGETQVAERLAGEFMESNDRPQHESNDAETAEADESQTPPAKPTIGLNFGSSLLGKRKTSPTAAADETEEAHKKLKVAIGDDSDDIAAAQIAEADEGENPVVPSSYLYSASDTGNIGDQSQIPRGVLEEGNATATAEEDNEIGQGNEMVDGVGVQID